MTPSVDEAARHLPRIVSYLGSWATAELLRGLLRNGRVLEGLRAGATAAELAELTRLPEGQAASLAEALLVEGFVDREDGTYRLTSLGRSAADLRGWLELLMSGYRGYFANADRVWAGDVDDGWRDMHAVGVASTRISAYGALPLVAALIREFRPHASTVVDAGCADARSLVRLCESMPDVRGVGVEPDPELARAARRVVAEAGMVDRIEIVGLGVEEYVGAGPTDAIVFGFVLHELVEGTGRDGVVRLLRQLGDTHPRALVVVVEVDASGRDDPEAMRASPYARGYYGPYFLVHELTRQRLLGLSDWRAIFAEAGFRILRERPIDPRFDPTGWEVGFALEPAR